MDSGEGYNDFKRSCVWGEILFCRTSQISIFLFEVNNRIKSFNTFLKLVKSDENHYKVFPKSVKTGYCR